VNSAEAKLMRPPSIFEIFTEMTKVYNIKVATIYEGAAVLTSLFREDWLYMNDLATHYSCNPHPGFRTFSAQFRDKYGNGYTTDRDGAV
jgi:hypothetical protein